MPLITGLSQHCFRGSRRHAARKQQEAKILELQMLNGQLQYDNWQLQSMTLRLEQQLSSWQSWWIEQGTALPDKSDMYIPSDAMHDNSEEEEEAALMIQRSFRRWRIDGPLSRHKRCKKLVSDLLDFSGFDVLKLKVRESARCSDEGYFDPQADLEAIQFQAACQIQRAWRKISGNKTAVSRQVNIMTSLRRMGSGPTFLCNEFSWPTRSFTARAERNFQRQGRCDDEDDEAALEEGLRLAAQERAQIRAAVLIQRFWRFSMAPEYSDDPDAYSSVCLGSTQADLDTLSDDCQVVLQLAEKMQSWASLRNGEFAVLRKECMASRLQSLIDAGAVADSNSRSAAFRDCLQHFDVKVKSGDDLLHVNGEVVTQYFRMYLASLQEALDAGTLQVSEDGACIVLACMSWTAMGHTLPPDIVV
eukprot:TRINITY_DN3114_c0_g2_i1.p1 TRINITY_DN3114_c0_g2~~TRINITY_DN3114_c0_g2_i1.p1  ORF type:complete len:418 (+),score=79.63 TRINITY_DN3114_c0_g2_i1:107-1360(+)